MERFFGSFMIENAQPENAPEEQDLQEIWRARRVAKQMAAAVVVAIVVLAILAIMMVTSFVSGEISPFTLLVGFSCGVSLLSSGLCLVLYDIAVWLWANRKAGMTVAYPEDMPTILVDFFESPKKIFLVRQAVTTVFSVGVLLALALIIYPGFV